MSPYSHDIDIDTDRQTDGSWFAFCRCGLNAFSPCETDAVVAVRDAHTPPREEAPHG